MHTSRAARLFALGTGTAILCVGLSACGNSGAVASQAATTDVGQESSPTTAAGKTKTARPGSLGDVTKAALLKKMMSEPESKEFPEALVACLAEVSLKYGDANDLKRYLEGSITSEEIKGLKPSNKAYWKEADKCTKYM
ncbi:hypothetical protein ABZ912_00370 [Nonomuraea angiospora]|uniref:hypothetical protein n=1 Tax=Nonomuraea angiospora TaxID=46172 RepID=UPI0033E80FC8